MLYSSYFPLGVPNGLVKYHAQGNFWCHHLAPAGGFENSGAWYLCFLTMGLGREPMPMLAGLFPSRAQMAPTSGQADHVSMRKNPVAAVISSSGGSRMERLAEM
jgi:hypothetical protein